ncbi:MAG: adenosylcobinamide-GDP ribazoletransferase [Planctomycetaceae bacterium]|nr:adenosylcobinamide-GDP ribazoletransferase [Planctomycetaceae bacterium]
MSDVSPIPEGTAQLPNQAATAVGSGRWAAFVAAVQFLTRVSLSTRGPVSAGALARCPVYFPVVGVLIGVFTSAVLGVACLFWSIWLAVIGTLAAEALLTGAFHEDAVADFCDAFGGGWTREDILRILKDSRIGTYGTLGLGLAVALRAGAMVEIMHRHGLENWLVWSSVLVASSAVGRWVIVLVMVCVPPVPSRESLSRDIGSQLNRWDLLAATLWTLPAAIWLAVQLPQHAALAVALVVPTVFWFMRLVNRRLGGITGDCLGCIGYVSQVFVLLAAAARWRP